MYKRDLSKVLEKELIEKEVLILYGARQVGKTTLFKTILKNKNSTIINCETPVINDIMGSKDIPRIKQLIGTKDFVAFDEAQKITQIGEVLKLMFDDESIKCKIIATGSSSFELSGRLTEPLTGRNRKIILYPISLNEITEKEGWLWIEENIERLLQYGQYPAVLSARENRKEIVLNELTTDYLYKDILAHEQLKNSQVIHNLLKALALQIGSQVSVNELARLLRISNKTVEKYLDLLEKSFIIYRLDAYSTNLRNELKKSSKYYFYDLGVRNAVLNNYSALDIRRDTGQLWENFCINERLKYNHANQKRINYYFWRTYDGAEIDLIEESGGKLETFEFKWRSQRKTKIPESFKKKYSPKQYNIITRNNFFKLLD